jgi:hypothetical protein
VGGPDGDGARTGRPGAVVVTADGRRGLRDGAGEADAAQLAAAVAGADGAGFVAREDVHVQIDGGEVAELRYADVQQLAGGRLQIQRVADAGPRRVEQSEGAANVVRLACRLHRDIAQRRPFP